MWSLAKRHRTWDERFEEIIQFRRKFGHFNVKKGPVSAQLEESGEDNEKGEENHNDMEGTNIDGLKGPASAQLEESGEGDEQGEENQNDTEGANIIGSNKNNGNVDDSEDGTHHYNGLHSWVRKQHKCT